MDRRRVIAHTKHEGGKWILNDGLLPQKPAAILMSDGVIFDFKMFSYPPIRRFYGKDRIHPAFLDVSH
jgi:hypothetical protein